MPSSGMHQIGNFSLFQPHIVWVIQIFKLTGTNPASMAPSTVDVSATANCESIG